MMSTMFPITVESEKITAPVVVTDEANVGKLSFAENFKESVDIPSAAW